MQIISAHRQNFQPGKNFPEKRGRFAQLLLRDIDRDINSGLLERFNENARLGTRSSAESDQLNIRSNLRRDFSAVSIENIDLGASDVILRQFANLLEQRSTALIVEILARQGARIGGKARDNVRQQIRRWGNRRSGLYGR